MGLFDIFRSKKTGPDQAVLLQLKKAGSNFSKLHPIEFFLYFPTVDAAERPASQLISKGFATNVSPGASGQNWLCLATKAMRPDLAALEMTRKDFEELTQSLGGEYDGWGTPVET